MPLEDDLAVEDEELLLTVEWLVVVDAGLLEVLVFPEDEEPMTTTVV